MKKSYSVKDVMTSNPKTVYEDSTVADIIKELEVQKFDHLPVINHNGTLTGMISKTDLYKKILRLSESTSGTTYSHKLMTSTEAKDIMTSDPVVVQSYQSLDFAIELLLADTFHALPVQEQEKLVGIITSKDILTYIRQQEITGV